MRMTTVLFDLDGTLLPMDQDAFIKKYFQHLSAYMAPHGYEPKALVDALWTSIGAMIQNDGSSTNEAVFWRTFCGIFGQKAADDLPIFDKFYRTDFQNAKSACRVNPQAASTIARLKAAGIQPVLATNPVFPRIATESRIRWAGLQPADFALYTTYENIGFSKPNPAYYREILRQLAVCPEECIMVGNDVVEDMVAKTVGMSVFLLTDCLINTNNEDISVYPHGDFNALNSFLDRLLP